MKAKRSRPDKAALPPGPSGSPGQWWKPAVISILLAALTWFTFRPVLGHGFVNYDDDVYVYENPIVARGLTGDGLIAAFSGIHAGNWHPITTLSHQVDCEFSGLNAGAHHRTNLVLHIATVILLFLALHVMTSGTWPSAAVAALFAIHPLRVESVAWIAERKDVLSGLLFMLTLWAYARYVRGPKSIARYLLLLVTFALGLMAKPMLVTVPFVLLLLDYWPLRRFDPPAGINTATLRRLVLEKLPLLALSLTVCVVTFLVQGEARGTIEALPFVARLNNASISCVAYVGQLFYPVNLAVFYPYPSEEGAVTKAAVALLVLVAISVTAFYWKKKRPSLLVGWLWYLAMLVPVIGLVQVGSQAHADRYTYLPQIGLCLALVWGVKEFTASWPGRRATLAIGTFVILGTLAVLARHQTRHWQDSESLWTHTLACTSSNALAESNLANALFKEGRADEALGHFQAALEIKSDYGDAHNGLGFVLLEKGRFEEAIGHFQNALQARPDSAAANNNLGMAYLQLGRARESISPFQRALKTSPNQSETHNNLGYALLQTGQVEAALAHYQRALTINPDYAGACNNLAWVLATSQRDDIRDGKRAVELARRAMQLSAANNVIILRTMAAAYAEAGMFSEAIQTLRYGLALPATQGSPAVSATLRQEITLYQSGQPLRSPSGMQ